MLRLLCPSLLLAPFCVASFVAPITWCQAQSSVSTNSLALTSPEGPLTSLPRTSSAEPAVKEAIAKPEAAIANLLADASALYRRGKLTTAAEKYRLMLLADPTSASAYAGLARIYLKQGDVAKAAEALDRGLAASDSDDLHVALGELYFREGKIPYAEAEWQKVLDSRAPNARAYFGLARVRHALSLHKTGKDMLEEARSLDANDPDIEMDWSRSLPLPRRIALLQAYLGSESSLVNDDHAEAQRYLEYLKLVNRMPDGSCHLIQRPSSAELPLERLLIDSDHLRGYGLRVGVNGHNSTLMLDTGATGIVLSQKAAQRAAIERSVGIAISGVGDGGGKTGYFGVARSIKIGGLEFENCVVRVLDKRAVLDNEGLIGADLFESFLLNIDFPKEKLRLSELPDASGKSSDAVGCPDGQNCRGRMPQDGPQSEMNLRDAYISPQMQAYTRFYRFGHCVLVPTRIGGGEPKLFLLDTGAYNTQITPDAARETTHVRKAPETHVFGISGAVKSVFSADKALFEFGRVRQENEDLVAFDLTSSSNAIGTEISGTLGFNMLRNLNIKIDYRDGLVDFDPPHR